MQELKSDNHFNALLLNLLHDLPSFELSISDWTAATQTFLKERLKLGEEVDFKQKTRSYKGKFDKAILSEPLNVHLTLKVEFQLPQYTKLRGNHLMLFLYFSTRKNIRTILLFQILYPVDKTFLAKSNE